MHNNPVNLVYFGCLIRIVAHATFVRHSDSSCRGRWGSRACWSTPCSSASPSSSSSTSSTSSRSPPAPATTEGWEDSGSWTQISYSRLVFLEWDSNLSRNRECFRRHYPLGDWTWSLAYSRTHQRCRDYDFVLAYIAFFEAGKLWFNNSHAKKLQREWIMISKQQASWPTQLY